MPSKAVNKDNKDNKPVKKEANKAVKKEIIVESEVEESEEESEIEESESEESESEEESEEEETGETEDKTIEKKEKPKKLSHEELLNEINKISESENTNESEISELEKLLLTKIKLRNSLRKSKTKYIGLLPKAYVDGLNKARKEKKKRVNNSKSGILAEHPIPPILLKFLNLPDNTLMMRPKVFSLLNNKFKELGLKKGQETILDKKTAKLFGFDEGHIIKFQACQKFLADIYEKANAKTTEVTL
jgi:hypothetical protein